MASLGLLRITDSVEINESLSVWAKWAKLEYVLITIASMG